MAAIKFRRTAVVKLTFESEKYLPAAYIPNLHSDSKRSYPEQSNVLLDKEIAKKY